MIVKKNLQKAKNKLFKKKEPLKNFVKRKTAILIIEDFFLITNLLPAR